LYLQLIETWLRKVAGADAEVVKVNVYPPDGDGARLAGRVVLTDHLLASDDESGAEVDWVMVARSCAEVAQEDCPDSTRVRLLLFAGQKQLRSKTFNPPQRLAADGDLQDKMYGLVQFSMQSLLDQNRALAGLVVGLSGHIGTLTGATVQATGQVIKEQLDHAQTQTALIHASSGQRTWQDRALDLGEEVARARMGLPSIGPDGQPGAAQAPSAAKTVDKAASPAAGKEAVIAWIKSIPRGERVSVLKGLKMDPDILEALSSE
jgi:hypothetical protein